ncbi:calcium-activated potassium channel subunit beta-3 [Sigmodon hispidus]
MTMRLVTSEETQVRQVVQQTDTVLCFAQPDHLSPHFSRKLLEVVQLWRKQSFWWLRKKHPFWPASGFMQPFSIPVQITLQGGRRRQGRTALPASGKSDGDPLKVRPKLPSSAGEDRATLLGIAMMASSVLMFFLLGTTVLKPFMLSSNREESNCTIVHTHIADDWLDFAFTCESSCQDQGGYPCLQVFVNLAHSSQKVLLHYDDEAVRTNPKCFYTPKCHRDRDDLLNSARDMKEFFDHSNGTFTCFYRPDGQLGAVLRKSGHKAK